MFFTKPDLTRGGRPTLLEHEELLFVQDSVGLYVGILQTRAGLSLSIVKGSLAHSS